MGKKGKNKRNQDGQPSNDGPPGQQQQQLQQQQQQPQQQHQQPQQQQQQQQQQPVQQVQGHAPDIVQGQGRGGQNQRGGQGGQNQGGRGGGQNQGGGRGRGQPSAWGRGRGQPSDGGTSDNRPVGQQQHQQQQSQSPQQQQQQPVQGHASAIIQGQGRGGRGGPPGQQQQQPQQQQQQPQQQWQPPQQQQQQPVQGHASAIIQGQGRGGRGGPPGQQQQQPQQQQQQPQQQWQPPQQQQQQPVQGHASAIIQGQGRGGRGGPPGQQQQQPQQQQQQPQQQSQSPQQQQQQPVQGHASDIIQDQGRGRGGQSQGDGRGGRGGQSQGDGRGGRGGQSQGDGRGGRGRGGQSQGDGRGGRGRGGQSQGDGRGGSQPPTGGGDYSNPSAAASQASSRAPSADSRASGGKPKGPSKPIPGSSPVKTSLSATQQATYRAQIPKRKNPTKAGTTGRPITVETNMIPISFGKNFCHMVTHYDVKLDPDKPRFMYRPVVEAVRLQHYPQRYPAFDGRCNLYAAGTLPFGESMHTTIEVENPQRQKKMSFKVTITRAREIDMSWLPHVKPGLEENEREQTAIQALDVILRAAAIRQKAVTVGRSFFTQPEPGRVVDLGSGMDLWVGSFQSAVLGWKPYFNIDVAHKAFPRNQKVLDLVQELCGDPRSNRPITVGDIEQSYNRRKLTDFLKGLKVTYEIPGQPSTRRTWNINDLGRSSRQATFELADGSVTTVENYFATEKRYRIRFPEYPTLWVGPRNKTLLIPMELCIIEAGQVTNAKLDERQTSTMIKYAATNTQTRKQKIMDGFAKLRMQQDPTANEFGVSVGNGFEKVPARVLNPPTLFDKREISVSKGVWRQNGFHTASVLPDKSWTILNLNDRTTEAPLRNLVQLLRNRGKSVGMDIGEPLTPFKYMRAPLRDVREIVQFYQEKKAEGIKLIIVIVPDKTGPVYGKVKQNAELNVGVLTQCLKAVTVERKMNDATAGNIILKINAKLNGTNQIFAAGKNPPCLNRPCMIVGADVTHPSPDSVGIPSIAAVAASHGPRAFKYNVKIRLQPPKTEIILHLETIMREQLLFFYKNTGHKPERIIFYRDGVSEGQFPQVMHHELQAIRNACAKLGGANKYEPKITFLVVQKRHHIRLFPTDPRNSDDRNGNVQAGTVVDTQITHPSHIDFYLVSHASIQGTARPTKYRCLWDDSDMSEDEIEQLTYYLCHMFSRCTRSVSYPAPTYYAHLAAFRARALTNEVNICLADLEQEQKTRMTIKEEILTGNPMFFV